MMKPKKAVRLLLLILVPLVLFHIGVLLKIAPQEIIWGGKLGSESDMYLLESISILVILYLILILLIKGSFIRPVLSPKVVKTSLWAFLILFVLNTVGNLLAKTTTEQVFALVTMVISFLLWVVLKKQDAQTGARLWRVLAHPNPSPFFSYISITRKVRGCTRNTRETPITKWKPGGNSGSHFAKDEIAVRPRHPERSCRLNKRSDQNQRASSIVVPFSFISVSGRNEKVLILSFRPKRGGTERVAEKSMSCYGSVSSAYSTIPMMSYYCWTKWVVSMPTWRRDDDTN